MTQRLSLATLGALGPSVAVPAYRRADLTPGIVHFGVGNFHRAHQAVYLDALFNTGLAHDWAIIGAGVMPSDADMRAKLEGQDYLTTVVEQSAEKSSARVTGPMIGFLPPGDPAAIIAQLADPAIRIVSLTVTEGGYFIDPATGDFNARHPDIAHDAGHPDAPRTVFGLILAGLRARRARGVPPFTVMSCDNVPGNGHVAQNAVVGLARLTDPALADWVQGAVAFPNGMVDRITPATGRRERDMLREGFGVEDAWPVFCEDFMQWVLEDNFPGGRPPLENVGVTFVDDVSPFEHMKIRILNGGHAIIAYPAALLDIHFVHDAMAHETIRAYLAKVEREEIIPVIPPVPGVDLNDYYALIERRFANPKIGDTIPRLCQDGSNRQPKFILPSTRDRLKAGGRIGGLALESALWCRYFGGTSDSGAKIAFNDAAADRLHAAAVAAKADPAAFLALEDIFGDLATNASFQCAFATALRRLWADGTEATLRRYLSDTL
jgi:mannitol 2-dehydrogenase